MARPSILPVPLNGTWKHYTPTDGLAGLRLQHIAEDAEGYLWFTTTTGGVSRFDGDTFTNFTTQDGLSGNQAFVVEVDPRGRVWFGCEGGGCWYDGHDEHEFHQLMPDIWGADSHITHLMVDRADRIWFAGFSRQGPYATLIGYCHDQILHDLSPLYDRDYPGTGGFCWGIAQDDAEDIWFAMGCLVRYDGHRFEQFGLNGHAFEPWRIERGPPDVSINALVQPPDGGPFWVGGKKTWGRFDGCTYQPESASIEAYVRKMQCDRAGRIWVCDAGNGILCLAGEQCHRFTPQDGLPHPDVSGMLLDREGHLWFSTWGGGASRYDPSSIVKVENGWPPGAISALAEDGDGRVWAGFGTLQGPDADRVACWDGRTVATWGSDEGLATADCMAIHRHGDGTLWLGDWDGLIHWDGRTFRRLGSEQGFVGTRVYALAEDEAGVLYVGHGDHRLLRLTAYDGRCFTALAEIARDGAQYISTNLIQGDKVVWFGVGGLGGQGPGRGIGCYSSTEGLSFYEEGLPDSCVEDLCEDGEGGLWIATIGGLSRFDGTAFRNFTTQDGLPGNYVQCLHRDGEDRLWIGTESGISCFDGTRFQTVHSEHIGTVYQILESAEGTFWLGTQDGLVRYVPQHVPPRVRLEQIVADQAYRPTDPVELIADSSVTFEYKALSFRTSPHHMLYTCRLRGHEEGWRPATHGRRAFYPHLPAGDYAFEVKAIDRDFNESDPTTVRVQVVPDPRTQGLTAVLNEGIATDEFIGDSPALRRVQAELEQVAPTQETVLILGETGTGKGVAARAVHRLSPRKDEPFIQVNCGAIPRDLVESELFGHEKGAFTGATNRRLGKVELARGGTLFLDEIGDMPLDAQVKLLRVLEERTFERLGSAEILEAQVRVVAATNRDLRQMVQEGTFREDLYFRLRVFEIELPPLRQRQMDIPLLASFFATRMAGHLDKPIKGLSATAEEVLVAHEWPGNVRELEHVVKRAVIVCPVEEIRLEDLALEIDLHEVGTVADEWVDLEEYERRYIRRVLEHTHGVIRGAEGAAAILGLNPGTLYSRMKKLGIQRKKR